MATDAVRRLEWAPCALDAYLATLAKIAEEDPHTADLVRERVERALALIQSHPGLGTLVLRRGERRFPIAITGHVINYRVLRYAIRIQLWYRARQQTRV
jgi:plasmid stabilization system protein ParE